MTRSTKVMLWVLVVLGLIILAGIVTGQPVPEKPKNYYHAEVTQGMGAAALIAKAPAEKWVLVAWDKHPDSEAYWHYMEGTNEMTLTNYTVLESKWPGQDWTVICVTNEQSTSCPVKVEHPWQWFRARGEWHW